MTNGAAIGYMVLASQKMGLDKATVERLERAMYISMDEYTEAEAERAYVEN